MAKTPGPRPTAQKPRTPAPTRAASVAVPAAKAEPAAPPKPRTSIPQFINEVRAEARKVTWTSRKETWITSVMVFIMVAVVSVFLFLVDFGVNQAITNIIKLGS